MHTRCSTKCLTVHGAGEGLYYFKHLQASRASAHEFEVSSALSVSANLHALDDGKQIHAFIVKNNIVMDVAAWNSLINFYFKCGSVCDAEKVLDEMSERDVYTWTVLVNGYALNGNLREAMDCFDKMPWRNTVSWNSVISACQREGCDKMAMQMFNRMRREAEVPNNLTFVAVLKACSCLLVLENGEGIHGCMVKSWWTKDVLAGCTLMDMYAKCGDDVSDVWKAFGDIENKNVVSWSILLAGYTQNGKIEEAEGIFCGMVERNVVSWNVMIAGYVQNGLQDRAFRLFGDMVRINVKPNTFTLTSLMSGCSNPRYAKTGESFHGYVIQVGLETEISICNSMITMYGEQGNVGHARLVFDMMPQYDVVSWTAMVAGYVSNGDLFEARRMFDSMPEKNLIAWNTMMFAYLQNGKNIAVDNPHKLHDLFISVDDALMFFHEMETSNVKPDHFSYNCALSACASVGAVELTRTTHCKALKRGFESDVGVRNALITAYGKCGCIREAEKIFSGMNSPDRISWNALLTGYSQNGRGNKALDFFEVMQKSGIEPNHVTFISLLSACSYIGEVKKGQRFFDEMVNTHGISPTKEHYACMVDLLGRAGLLSEAEAIIRKMPIEPDAAVWGALIGACKMHENPTIGRRAANQIFTLEPDNSAAHIALAKTFAAARMWDDVAEARTIFKEKKLLKEPGCSWIEIRNQKHAFLSCGITHLQNNLIQETLSSLYCNMKDRLCTTF
ncbi:TPR-like protein [Dioscorea alata]|uniref:TPR-like protein n=1 Tax=Dioscorea alata TaxID=55571 RepID=A0ACB7WDY3_DIOAL|nr:TPR-like protein [Dioscorea alata]